MYFIHNGEFDSDEYERLSETDPYLDGDWLTFKGVGMFVDGVLTHGPAFFIQGDGGAFSFSWMINGRPAN